MKIQSETMEASEILSNDIGKDIYEYDVDMDSQSAPANVVRFIDNNSKVLEVGAGPGSITRILTNMKNCSVTALEIEDESLKMLSNYCEKAIKADLNDHSWPKLVGDEKYDFVIAADVLEHVYDPWKTLDNMKSLLNENGSIILSLPHAGHNSILACLFNEDLRLSNWGLLDRTHIRFFGIKNIQNLIESAGLKVMEARFVTIAPDATEFADVWANTPKNLRSALSQNSFGNVYQVVTRSISKEQQGKGIELMSQQVPKTRLSITGIVLPNQAGRNNLKGFARKYFSVSTRRKIHNILYRIGIRP